MRNISNVDCLGFCPLKLQVMDNYGAGRPSVMKTARTLLKEDGWRGFYRGFGPRFFNMSLYGTTMIVTYELISMLTSPFQQAQNFGRILQQNLVLLEFRYSKHGFLF